MIDVLPVLGSQDVFPDWYADPAIDDSLGWLADILSEENVTGTFLFQVARAEQLARHARDDVIQKVARHDIGQHGRDRHPIDPEVVERLGWKQSVGALARIDAAEIASLRRVFRKMPVGSSQHGPTFVPQLYAVARDTARPYLFGYPAAPPLYSVSWYCGALNIPYETPADGFMAFDGVYDAVLADDAAFGLALDRLRAHVARCQAAGQPLLSVFICHPERLVYPDSVARYQYADGENCPEPTRETIGSPVRRADPEVARALVNFRALIRALRDAPGARIVTVGDMSARYGREAQELGRADLATIAAQASRTSDVVLGGPISPAEALAGWAASLVRWRMHGTLPDRLTRLSPLGPLTMPRACSDRDALSIDDAVALARRVLRALGSRGSPHLPASVTLGEVRFGLGGIYGALAGAYERACAGAATGDIRIASFPRYPRFGDALATAARAVENYASVRPGLGTDKIALCTKLQTWTLKAAGRLA